MNTDQACQRRYRRLLWAYPRWYRRERGTEILTTVLDAAAPGRRWPSARDAVDLLRGGVRLRVGPPRPGYLLIFVPISLLVGLIGSAWAAGQALDRFAARPSVATAAAVALTATGEPPHDLAGPIVSCSDVGCPSGWSPDGDNVVAEDRPLYQDNGQDAVEVGYWPPDDALAGWIGLVRDRLSAAGWTVDPISRSVYGDRFTAHNADLQVQVWTIPGAGRVPSGDDDYLVTAPAVLLVQHSAPPGLELFSGAGFLAGLVIGWLLSAWIVRRARAHPDRRKTTVLLAGTWAVLLALPVDCLALTDGVARSLAGNRALALAPTDLTSLLIVLVVPAVLTLLLTIAIAAWPPSPPPNAENATMPAPVPMEGIYR